MNKFTLGITTAVLAMGMATTANAQVNAADSVMNHAGGHRLSVGGYGEVAYSRMFYSNNPYRYSQAAKYKDDPSRGQFDIPHAVIYLGYDFGKGWTMGSEIEFEHTGTGVSTEKEYEESGEWEQEVEKGGEVELEQFWIQKSFNKAVNLRFGHIVVPFGLTNAHHEPLNFFTVYRPEGEANLFPCTWHQTGVSLWGHIGNDWKYELQFLPGLDGLAFSREHFVQKGAGSAFEFAPANKYAAFLRIDNTSLKGLRLGLSGYYGHTLDNSDVRDANSIAHDLSGKLMMVAFDFTLNRWNWIVRGNVDYAHLPEGPKIQQLGNRGRTASPYNTDEVGKGAIATSIEAGWDMFSQIQKLRADNQKLYIFGRYEYYNPYIYSRDNNFKEENSWTKKNRIAFGVNYYPIKEIVFKAEYSKRFLKSQYNDEPSFSVGVAYEGFFL